MTIGAYVMTSKTILCGLACGKTALEQHTNGFAGNKEWARSQIPADPELLLRKGILI